MGNYVSSRTVKKVFPITKTSVATMAGGAADCYYWIKVLTFQAIAFSHKYKMPAQVKCLAKMLSSILREQKLKGLELSVGTMIAGWDDDIGPSLFYVDDNGSCVKGKLFSVGSGSSLVRLLY
jgi:20S proteasome subunit beta 5